MCIRDSLPSRTLTTHPIATFNFQVSISSCVVEFGYGIANHASDTNDSDLYCFDCKTRYILEHGNKNDFTLVLRHYISIGLNLRKRLCTYCLCDLHIIQPLHQCDICSEAFIAFLAHLREINTDFNSLTDPAVVDIDPDIGRHNIIFSKSLSTFLYSLYAQRGNRYLIPVETIANN